MSQVKYLEAWCLSESGKCPPPEHLDDQWQRVEDKIEGEKVIVFSKSWCPYCAKVKQLLQKQKIDFTVVELDLNPAGEEIQKLLAEHTGQRTVPNVFVGGVHVGGASDTLEAWENGRLKQLIEKAEK